MLKKFLLTFVAAIVGYSITSAQVTTIPMPLQEDSQNVVIYYHADQGNKALADLPASTLIYAHTGVLTNKSTGNSDWKYAPTWGANEPKYLMTYEGPNLYSLNLGDLRTYYGITDPAEKISKLAFVFRNSDGSKQGKTETNGDIFVDVLGAGLQISLESSLEGTLITPSTANVTFRLGATKPANLSISINGEKIADTANSTLLECNYTFPGPGNYSVYGNAELDGEIKSVNLKLAYATPSPTVNYPGGVPKQGTVRNDDGSVTFCIAAPEKTSVILVGSWNDYDESEDNLMNYQDYNGFRYFWLNINGLDSTSLYPYYYIVDGKTKVGDPYAKLILDPYNDKYIPASVYPDLPAYPTSKVRNVMLGVYQENINDYEWTDNDFVRPDKDNLVVYELLLRDFTGTEGKASGNGTIKKALEKLPYLKELGVNVIELLPINEFNGNISWGYNPNFYFAPDKAYGTPDDYKLFINTCHENGIAVVLDMVFNQSDGLHPWYQMYMPGQNPFYNLDAPHAYSVLNDWNQGYPLVRQQWKDVVKYWVEEYHVDGYRFDLVKGLGNNDSYPNSGDSGTNAYNESRVKNMRDIQIAMEEIADDLYFINENLAGAEEENQMAATGMLNWANVNHEGGQYAKGYQSNSGLNRFNAKKDGRTWGSTVSYLESHDEQRLAYEQDQYGANGVKGNHQVSMRRLGSAAAQMILVPGAHMIWQFSELGNAQSTKNVNGGNNTDPKIVNWNLLNDPDNYGLFRNYCELIDIRLCNPELFSQSSSYNNNCLLWTTARKITSIADGKELVCVINPSIDKEMTTSYAFASTNEADYRIASKSYATNPAYDVAQGTITVPANSYVVIVSNNVTKIESVDSIETTLSARGVRGALLIENAPAGYQVYSLNGVKVASSDEVKAEILLPAGIYIVRSGNETTKAVVL